jgi:hypothetical protein
MREVVGVFVKRVLCSNDGLPKIENRSLHEDVRFLPSSMAGSLQETEH